jgi:hypothetical protein
LIPPKTHAHLKLLFDKNFLTSFSICIASYRVGDKTKIYGPFPSGLVFSILQIPGIKKASVFPEPVLDIPIKSLPLIIRGIACA